MKLESPPDLTMSGRKVTRDALPFVLVAYGLSVLAPPIPLIETPDEGFVMDSVGPLVVASACSGHGFKFGSVIGELAASLITGEPSPESITKSRSTQEQLASRLAA